MNKRIYTLPDFEVVCFMTDDVLVGSTIIVVDPERPTEVGGIGEEGEL